MTSPMTRTRTRRTTRRITTLLATGRKPALATLLAPALAVTVLGAAPSAAGASPGGAVQPGQIQPSQIQVSRDHDRLPPGRTIRRYTVRPGDTPAGLAVRFHAWTAELVAINHLGPRGLLIVGERIKIPVVDAAVPRTAKTNSPKSPQRSRPGREQVRRIIARTARRHGVDPQLALAVAWQESGWQMHLTSSARAIGAMQVLRPTGVWMSLYAGRDLKLRRTRDNALAGVLLLRHLGQETSSRRRQIAAYYQGLGAVREHGLFGETRPYVRNVLAIKRRLERGLPPG